MKIDVDDIERISEGQKTERFSLKNDGDMARVQFAIESYNDIQAYTVHRVKPEGFRYDTSVDCLRGYNEPLDKCPLCQAGQPVTTIGFVGVYDQADKQVKAWQRSRKYLTQFKQYCERYKPLKNYVFDIERHGAAGDIHTTYPIFPVPDAKAEPIPDTEINVFGTYVEQWSADEMRAYLASGLNPKAPARDSMGVNEPPQFARRPVQANPPQRQQPHSDFRRAQAWMNTGRDIAQPQPQPQAQANNARPYIEPGQAPTPDPLPAPMPVPMTGVQPDDYDEVF